MTSLSIAELPTRTRFADIPYAAAGKIASPLLSLVSAARAADLMPQEEARAGIARLQLWSSTIDASVDALATFASSNADSDGSLAARVTTLESSAPGYASALSVSALSSIVSGVTSARASENAATRLSALEASSVSLTSTASSRLTYTTVGSVPALMAQYSQSVGEGIPPSTGGSGTPYVDRLLAAAPLGTWMYTSAISALSIVYLTGSVPEGTYFEVRVNNVVICPTYTPGSQLVVPPGSLLATIGFVDASPSYDVTFLRPTESLECT